MADNYLTDLVIQNVGDGVIFIDKQLKIREFNPAAVRYSGIDTAKALKKSFAQVLKFIKNDQKPVLDLIKETLADHGSSLYHHATLACEEGASLPIIYNLVPVNDKNHNICGCLFVFRDYKLDRYKIDFLSMVAHQLKTPLGSMRWNLETLLALSMINKKLKVADVVRDIYTCNSRMISLIDDLLNASQIDARKVINKPEPIEISDVIKRVIKELSFQIKQKRLKVKLNINYKESIIIDAKHFREVVQNILSNSIKYNRQGGGIDIGVKESRGKIIISIGDTGIGIPSTELPLIFSRSFRAKNAIDTQIDGSGLGLYVAKSFVENWGGTIKCQSVIGKGTTIVFTVPKTLTEGSLGKNLSV